MHLLLVATPAPINQPLDIYILSVTHNRAWHCGLRLTLRFLKLKSILPIRNWNFQIALGITHPYDFCHTICNEQLHETLTTYRPIWLHYYTSSHVCSCFSSFRSRAKLCNVNCHRIFRVWIWRCKEDLQDKSMRF